MSSDSGNDRPPQQAQAWQLGKGSHPQQLAHSQAQPQSQSALPFIPNVPPVLADLGMAGDGGGGPYNDTAPSSANAGRPKDTSPSAVNMPPKRTLFVLTDNEWTNRKSSVAPTNSSPDFNTTGATPTANANTYSRFLNTPDPASHVPAGTSAKRAIQTILPD